MTTYKPYRSEIGIATKRTISKIISSDYNEVDHSVMEALSVHLGSGSLFEGYAE